MEVSYTLENKIKYKRLQAKSRKIIKTNNKKSTPIKKVWDKVKKIEDIGTLSVT